MEKFSQHKAAMVATGYNFVINTVTLHFFWVNVKRNGENYLATFTSNVAMLSSSLYDEFNTWKSTMMEQIHAV